MNLEIWRLRQLQAISPEAKVQRTTRKIREFVQGVDGQAYVAWSGGMDSRVLLDLVRTECGFSPESVPAVFIDTGLEYPEVREVALRHAQVVLRPKLHFRQVIEKYGYPVVSKVVAHALHKIRTSKSEFCRQHYLTGMTHHGPGKAGKLPAKWHYLTNADFPISDQCCDVMKKRPAAEYQRQTGRKPMLGMRVDDSKMRERVFVRERKGMCNAFGDKPSSWPLAIWTDEDVWWYVKSRKLDYPIVYDQGATGTGCFACMFGIHMEKGLNRFQRMYLDHPKLWKACMDGFGCRKVMAYLKLPVEPPKTPEEDGLFSEREDNKT
jgi:3'-phosphoadenosine 5'-phosphosulfate sulfotransferase (PAPS reductase)/FAD synthetase